MENAQPSRFMFRRAAPAIIGAAVAGVLFALYKPFPLGVRRMTVCT